MGVWSLVLVLDQQLGNEILSRVRDVVPDWVREGELTKLNFLHNFLVGSAVKWRNTGQNDESDDSARPNIALGAIVFGEHLGGNIIRST